MILSNNSSLTQSQRFSAISSQFAQNPIEIATTLSYNLNT